jgi:hypothetical protein
MIKPIKFDLKLDNGTTTLRTLDDLEENLTPALFEHFHSGKLAKWLRVRKLEELAEKVEALSTQHLNDKNELEVKLFKNLCEIFVSDVSEDDAHEAIEHYKTIEPSSENSNDDEVEQLKDEIEALKTEIELLKNQSIGENEGKTANDEQSEWVDETVIENDDELLKLLEEGDETQRAEIALLPNLSATLQNKLLEDSAESVLIALAGNTSINNKTQAELVKNPSQNIEMALAGNTKLNNENQKYLAAVSSNEAKLKLATNSSICFEVLEMILFGDNRIWKSSDWRIRDIREKILLDLASNSSLCTDSLCTDSFCLIMKKEDSPRIRECLAKNPSLPEDLQTKLLAYESNEIRINLANNPAIKELQQEVLFGTCETALATKNYECIHSLIALLNLFRNPSSTANVKSKIIHFIKKNLIQIKLKELQEDPHVDDKFNKMKSSKDEYYSYDPKKFFNSYSHKSVLEYVGFVNKKNYEYALLIQEYSEISLKTLNEILEMEYGS